MRISASIIVNLESKRSEKNKALKAQEILESKGISTELSLLNSGKDLSNACKAAALSGRDIIIAGGGDGTISSVAQVLVGNTKTALGILPLGTRNNFAKDLNIPSKLEDAVEIIAKGHAELISVGEVNGNFFINNSGIGIYPEIVLRREREESQGKARVLAFAKAIWQELKLSPEFRVEISTPEEKIIRHTPLVFIGNGFYDLRNFGISKREIPNGNTLSIFVLQRSNALDLIRVGAENLLNLLGHEKKLERFNLPELQIETDTPSVYVSCDGEIIKMKSPLHYKIRTNALKVIKPKEKHA